MGAVAKLAGLGAVLAGLVMLAVGTAGAANSPTYRDCSFVGGLDPDFVQLMGTTAGPNNTLTVPASQGQVQVKASESSDPGDSNGHDTLKVTVSAPNVAPRTVSAAGTGMAIATVPLSGAASGASYTVDWIATFDNGNHLCPGSQTPQNAMSNPFVVTVTGVAPTTPPTSSTTPGTTTPAPTVHHRKSRCHTKTFRAHGHSRKVRVCSKTKKKSRRH
jgi:hypothetical protein